MTPLISTWYEKLLAIDMKRVALLLGFSKEEVKALQYCDICDILKDLNILSQKADQYSKSVLISIAALLWENSGAYQDSLSSTLVYLFSKIGYAPSSVVLEKNYSQDNKYNPMYSIIAQLNAAINQIMYDVRVLGVTFTFTEFQYNIWKTIDQKRLCGISAPPSAGKSFVLILKAIERVIKYSYDVIYVVPTLSLVNQVTEDFNKLFKKMKWSDYEILNSYTKGFHDDIPKIYVLTQEKAIGAFSIDEIPFSNLTFLIIDEIQNIERISSDGNEMRSKILLDVIYEFRYIDNIVSIVISGPRIRDIGVLGEKLFGEKNIETIETNINPVLNITYSIARNMDGYILKQYASHNKSVSLMKINNASSIIGFGKRRYNEAFLLYLGSIINRFGNRSYNIIFSPTSRQARETALALCEQRTKVDNALLHGLAQYMRDTVRENYSLAKVIEYGVAYHHGKLPTHIRKVVEVAAEMKLVNNIACTTTLMQGVNLPAQNVIIRNPHLYINKGEDKTELSPYEMANLKGRAGRLLKDLIGRTYVLDENEFTSSEEEYACEHPFDDVYKDLHYGYENIYNNRTDEVDEALLSGRAVTVIDDSSRFVVTFIRQSILRHGKGSITRLAESGIRLTIDEYRSISKTLDALSVPKEICLKNRYWDPFVLDMLFVDRDFPAIPNEVMDSHAGDKLLVVLRYMRESEKYAEFFQKRVKKRDQNDFNLRLLCENAIKWAREKKLKDILKSAYFENDNNIEDMIARIHNTISYDLPVLLRPIYDTRGIDSALLTYMEMGAYNPITRKLIEIGIPRETAIEIEENYLELFSNTDESYEGIRKVLRSLKLPYWIDAQIKFLI